MSVLSHTSTTHNKMLTISRLGTVLFISHLLMDSPTGVCQAD